MKRRRPAAWVVMAFWLAMAFVFMAACSRGDSPENVGEAREDVFANGGFEMGAAGMAPPSWPVTPFLNPGITVQTPQTRPGLNLQAAIAGHPAPVPLTVTMVSAGGPLSQPDAFLGAAASLRWPRYGNQCALVNQGGRNQNVNSMAQTMTVAAGDVDPMDGKIHLRFVVAPVLENPGHPANEQPYFFVQATNVTQGNAILYSNFNFSNQAGVPWKTLMGGGTTYVYTDWQLVDISPGSPALNMGDMVKLELIAAGCSLGAHMGQLYVDGVGATVPGLFVSGTGPAQANACDDITYKLTYENGAATPATGVTVTFNTPPNTTFKSINAPGLACVTPGVGMAGLVTCTIGNLPAGAGGSFTITVNITCGTTGTITAGNYAIQGTGIETLLGPVINTMVGCTQDSQCAAGNWCDESANACTPTLANGTGIPNDPPHTGPTVNGTCTAAAGALVCTSGVCDTADNGCGYANGDGPCTGADSDVVCRSAVCDPDGKCGYANGDGPCTGANAAIVCRSGVCDPDGNCGYANGDGPCDMTNGGTVCRSAMCSTGGTCEPAGGCNVDADCAAGTWCNETTHLCAPQVANGGPVPTDGAHVTPKLDGTCTAAAAMLTCVSGVCDTSDNKCGYANGDGPCTGGDGGVVCRSKICATTGSNTGKCVACVMDSQCPGAMPSCNLTSNTCSQCTTSAQCSGETPICDTGSSTCVPCNGDMGSGATHACDTSNNPFCFLGGSMAGACGKCSMDSDCQGHMGNICDTPSGLCKQGCHTDADCSNSQWCDGPSGGTGTCTPKLPDGTPLPAMPSDVATCTPEVGVRVCVSGVCDTGTNTCGKSGCTTDGDCPSGDFCMKGACTPKLPIGDSCTGPDQCASNDCADGVCSGIIGSGNGLICAARETGSGGEGGAGAVGLLLAAAGLSLRKRGRRRAR